MSTDSERSQETPSATVEAKSEIQEYLEVSHQRHKLFPRAALVGLCAGGIAVIFRALLAAGDALRNDLITRSHSVPTFGWLFPMLFSATGALLASAMVFCYAPLFNAALDEVLPLDPKPLQEAMR
jgi:CIC family chloride channel protein